MVFSCVICYALLSADRENKITYCGHLYHSNCILNWLKRNKTCPVCRQTLLETELFQVYPTFDEGNDAHLDSNCPAHALRDELNNFSDENRNLKEDLTEMREKYNESNDYLQLKQSILESLELQLEKMTLEKHEENDAHLDSNCPAHALKDELIKFSNENRNLKEELKEMRKRYNELNYNLQMKQSSLESLELQLKKITLKKQDVKFKLTSKDEHKKKNLDGHKELDLINLDSVLIENNQICNKIKENKGELKFVQETLILSNSELDKKNKELSSAYKKIESLECLKESLLLQNINYKTKSELSKCDICKELINQVDESTKLSECKVELRHSPTKNKSDFSKLSDTRPSELESGGNQANLFLEELSQHRLFKISPARAKWKREMELKDDMSHC